MGSLKLVGPGEDNFRSPPVSHSFPFFASKTYVIYQNIVTWPHLLVALRGAGKCSLLSGLFLSKNWILLVGKEGCLDMGYYTSSFSLQYF